MEIPSRGAPVGRTAAFVQLKTRWCSQGAELLPCKAREGACMVVQSSLCARPSVRRTGLARSIAAAILGQSASKLSSFVRAAHTFEVGTELHVSRCWLPGQGMCRYGCGLCCIASWLSVCGLRVACLVASERPGHCLRVLRGCLHHGFTVCSAVWRARVPAMLHGRTRLNLQDVWAMYLFLVRNLRAIGYPGWLPDLA